MDWCSVYLTPQALPKYIYLFTPSEFTPGAAPLRWMGPNRNPRWNKSGLRVYVIVSSFSECIELYFQELGLSTRKTKQYPIMIRVMALNATFNNISVSYSGGQFYWQRRKTTDLSHYDVTKQTDKKTSTWLPSDK